jgi:hypothetical protein
VDTILLLLLALTAPPPAPTVIDLGDDWAPRLFSETGDLPQAYRRAYVALANERPDATEPTARRDRFYELFGISPRFGVIRGRLLDEARHACHAAIDDGPLRATARTLAPGNDAIPARHAALAVVQRHLACEGSSGDLRRDLALYQRRHMLPSLAVVDAETREVLLTPSRELDFRTLLRSLRERVVDATGLIEDGSAGNAWEPVLGRFIDAAEYRHALRPDGVTNAAPDLVSRATESAARALGWTSPEMAARALAQGVPPRMTVALPPLPAYHDAAMELRAEIDRGDVWTSYPVDAAGRPRPSPAKNRPTLTLYARTANGDVALVRWPTTIGAWKPEKLDGGAVGLRYKASPVGRFYWRDLLASPAWFPPPTTPDDELVRRGADGRWRADQEAVGPGYRSAYGLVALVHDRAVVTSAGPMTLADIGIRTHGSGNYRSILRGSSHGCHRLFNHLAIRLGSFLLAHRQNERHGLVEDRYRRIIHWQGHTITLRAETRGYRYELQPPVPVDVLPGRTVRSRPAPNVQPGPASPRPDSGATTAAPPQT